LITTTTQGGYPCGGSFPVAVWQPIEDSQELLFACLVYLVLLITIKEFKTMSHTNRKKISKS
jgi:hypothetical protein